MEQKLFVLDRNGKRASFTLEEVLRALGCSPDQFWGLGIRIENDGEALEAYPTGDAAYPAITIDGYDRQNRLYYLSTSELPNEDHKAMNTYLYGGCAEVESDDWLARISHGYRDEKDNTRHIIYIDRKLATTVSTNIEQSDAATEAELNDNK